jgi:PhzF family phenazine biosynthesis protein
LRKIPIFIVDAFAEQLFGGNPAAVCPLEEWLPEALLQSIAAENNLSETAYFVPSNLAGADFQLRWFTPTEEVDLCGHATLASGHVLLNSLGLPGKRVVFATRSGMLTVERDGEGLSLDMPALPPQPLAEVPKDLSAGLGAKPQAWLCRGHNYVAVFAQGSEVAQLAPDMAALTRLAGKGVIVTAPGGDFGVDFVSRYFTPARGVAEDPVTGSAHCVLVPYWAERLKKTRLDALQVSARRGRLRTELLGERVRLGGRVVPYLRGEIAIP